MKVDEQVRSVRPDNLFDVLFNGVAGRVKESAGKKMVFSGAQDFDVLEREGTNVQVVGGARKAVEVDKLKVSKQFKLINPVPRFQSIPATPQFFDVAGTYIEYPDLEEAMAKYKAQGGFFKKFTGFFGR